MSVTGHPVAGMVRLVCSGLAPHSCRVDVADGVGGWTKLVGVKKVSFEVEGGQDQLNQLQLTVYADDIHIMGEVERLALQNLVDGAKMVVTLPPAPDAPGECDA